MTAPEQPPSDATLQELAQIRRRTRRVAHSSWFPLTLFGSLLMLSAPLCEVGRGEALGIFWLVAGPGGMLVVARFFHTRGLRLGFNVAPTPYVLAGLVLIVGAFVIGPALALPAGIALFALIDRSLPLGVIALALAIVGVAIELGAREDDCLFVEAAYGATLTACGLGLRYLPARLSG